MKVFLSKLKNFTKKNILGFILGLIFCGGIAFVNADYRFTATKVYYDKANNLSTKTNVGAALDELYERAQDTGSMNADLGFGKSKVIPKGYTSGGTVTCKSWDDDGHYCADSKQPTVNKVLERGDTYTIPAGYHDGTSTITNSVGKKAFQFTNLSFDRFSADSTGNIAKGATRKYTCYQCDALVSIFLYVKWANEHYIYCYHHQWGYTPLYCSSDVSNDLYTVTMDATSISVKNNSTNNSMEVIAFNAIGRYTNDTSDYSSIYG